VACAGPPGGAPIITTVPQIPVNRIDFGMPLPDAIAAPPASPRNSAVTQAEPEFTAEPTTPGLEARGQSFQIVDTAPLDPSIKISPLIGAASGLELPPGGQILAAAEPRGLVILRC
jgi:gamma-glutamyltranspeptidase / glutathione hydrolase